MPKRASVQQPVRKRKLKLTIYNSMAEVDAADHADWAAQTPAARLRELERLRQLNYGYGQGKPLPRFSRVLKVLELDED